MSEQNLMPDLGPKTNLLDTFDGDGPEPRSGESWWQKWNDNSKLVNEINEWAYFLPRCIECRRGL